MTIFIKTTAIFLAYFSIGTYLIFSTCALIYVFGEPATKCLKYSEWKLDKKKSYSLHKEKNRRCVVYKVLEGGN